jgi:hypothetical protein
LSENNFIYKGGKAIHEMTFKSNCQKQFVRVQHDIVVS